jgi:hypothetical protein
MPNGDVSRRSFVTRGRTWLLAAAALVVLYAGLGFLGLPWLIRRQLEQRGSAFLRREVTAQKVRVNPFALSVTIEGLLVKDRDGGPLLSWDELYVNAKIWPLLKKEARLDALRLVRFRLRTGLDSQGRLKSQDVLDALRSGEDGPPAKKEGRPWVFGIDRLDIERAEIDFKDLSRRRPFETQVGPFTVELKDFRTRPDATAPYSFTGTTESGETFTWAGNVLLDPIRSSGRFSFENLQLRKYSPYYEESVGFELRDGRLGVKARYELEWGPGRRLVRIAEGGVSVRSLALVLPGASSPAVELPEGDVAGIALDVLARNATVDSVVLRGGVVRARRGPDGKIDLMAMSGSAGRAPGSGAPPAGAPSPSEGAPPLVASVKVKDGAGQAPPMQWTLRALEISGWRVELDDALPSPPARLALAPVEVRMENLSSDARSTAKLDVRATIEGKGGASAEGTVSIHRPSADLAVRADGLLTVANPYIPLHGNLDARLRGGKMSVSGRARFDGGAQPASWGFDGDVKVEGFALLDARLGQELARWRSLQITGIKAAPAPAGTSIKLVRWVEPRVQVQISESGSSNLKRVLRTDGKDPRDSKAEAEATAAAGKEDAAPERSAAKGGAPPKPPPYPFSVASFQVVRGAAEFTDRSLEPPVSLGVADLDVRVRGLSTAVNARAQVVVRGIVGGGPFEVNGTLSPQMVNDATDLKVTSKGIDLGPLSPYCGKYLGYLLEKGKLDLDLGYRVAKRNLEGKNLIHVDQFTLSEEPTGSKEATSLPVKLGLAILRDKDGLIELDVPVEGNIDDPSFRLGKLIWKGIANVFTKLVTAPFTALARLAGGTGGGRLDVVDFLAGSAGITPSSDKSIQGLGKALGERPGLRLAIEPVSDPAADGRALQVMELRRRAAEAKGKAAKGGPVAAEEVELSDEEYTRFLAAAYKALGPAPATPAPASQPASALAPASPAASAPAAASPAASAPAALPAPPAEADPAAMEDRVLATIPVPPDALRALEQRRAEAVRARLTQGAGIDPARLSVAEPGERARKEGGTRVYFELR